VPTVVNGGLGKLFDGAPTTPAKTMFQLEPLQLPNWELRDSHCCCEPDRT
jgi:hypothetical protein